MTAKFLTVPFKRWHLEWLEEHGYAEGGIGPVLNDQTLTYMERINSWTCVCDGDPVACGGVVEQWPGRYTAWAYLNRLSSPHMVPITRTARSILDAMYGRVEMTVRCDFESGHRWAKLLGFHVETPTLVKYGPEGEDHVGYIKVK